MQIALLHCFPDVAISQAKINCWRASDI